MKETDEDVLEDILENIEYIETYMNRLTLEAFLDSTITQDALIRRVMVVGEASTKISEETREKIPLEIVVWKQMRDMRNVLIHDYGHIDLLTVWDTCTTSIPELKKAIIIFLKK